MENKYKLPYKKEIIADTYPVTIVIDRPYDEKEMIDQKMLRMVTRSRNRENIGKGNAFVEMFIAEELFKRMIEDKNTRSTVFKFGIEDLENYISKNDSK